MKIKTKALVVCVCQPTSKFSIPIFKMLFCCYFMLGTAANELQKTIKFGKICKFTNTFFLKILWWLQGANHWQVVIISTNQLSSFSRDTNLCIKTARMYNQLFTATAAHSHLFKFNNKKFFLLQILYIENFIFSPTLFFNQFSWNFWNKF